MSQIDEDDVSRLTREIISSEKTVTQGHSGGFVEKSGNVDVGDFASIQ